MLRRGRRLSSRPFHGVVQGPLSIRIDFVEANQVKSPSLPPHRNGLMVSARVKKITSLLVLVMVLAVSLFGICEETHATEKARDAHSQGSCSAAAKVAPDHCPPCSGEGESGADHCASACYCACHLPVASQPLQIHHSPAIAELTTFEAFTALPEVYLPKFIPPHILV